jgi:hypothetical protein
VASCDGRFASGCGAAASDRLLGDTATSAIGSCGVQPGPGYARIDTRPPSSTGVRLDAELNKLVVIFISISSAPDRHFLRFIAV